MPNRINNKIPFEGNPVMPEYERVDWPKRLMLCEEKLEECESKLEESEHEVLHLSDRCRSLCLENEMYRERIENGQAACDRLRAIAERRESIGKRHKRAYLRGVEDGKRYSEKAEAFADRVIENGTVFSGRDTSRDIGAPLMSTGEPSTLGNHRKPLVAMFGEDNAAVRFIDQKIAESPNGENEVVLANEGQFVHLLVSMINVKGDDDD